MRLGGPVRQVAIVDMLFFFGVLLVGFAYLWRFGYLDWVRSAATTRIGTPVAHSTRWSTC